MTRRHRQRGVALVEFALVAGLFLLVVTTLFDVGKGVYVKNTLDASARDGARVAITLSSPTLKQIQTAVQNHSADVSFATGCPFSSSPSSQPLPQDNKGEIYLNLMPSGGNPGNEIDTSKCTSIPATAQNNQAFTVTIVYSYKPITPFVAQFVKGGVKLVSSSTMTTEY